MRSPDWRLLIDPPQSAAVNMASDEAIAIAFSEEKAPSTLRLYQWSAPSFSIGAFQELRSGWLTRFEDLSKQQDITLVRRITGGRGLLHDREVTYAIIASTENPLFSGGIKATFYSIAKGLLAGLKRLGVEAQVYTPTKKERGSRIDKPLCFSSTSWYEIAAGGKKLIGSAQRRWRVHFLQQGTLIHEPSRITFEKGADGMAFVSENQITLADLLPTLTPIERVADALKLGFEEAFDLRFVPGRLTSYESALIKRLVAEKYGNPRWNLDREGRAGKTDHLGREAQNSM